MVATKNNGKKVIALGQVQWTGNDWQRYCRGQARLLKNASLTVRTDA
jgi:hypothetical protein